MPLRKRQKVSPEGAGEKGGEVGEKKKKRQRIFDFFRSRKKKGENEATHSEDEPKTKSSEPKPGRDSKITETASPIKSPSSVEPRRTSDELFQQEPTVLTALPTPPPEPKEKKEKLYEGDIHALFSGAPQFKFTRVYGSPEPQVSFPWDKDVNRDQVSDAVALAHPAFPAATLRPHVPVSQRDSGHSEKALIEYEAAVFEVPSMLGAQGVDPGTVSFNYFLQLPEVDSLITDIQQSQSSNDFLEAVRNKELMQTNPERLGIRPVEMYMVHERLAEIGDILDAFRESPERLTILNNQSVGDLYATLFGKFLTPPRYDPNTTDPTGLKVQIDDLLNTLKLKGVWYDFSLVEWRIRLGQILWSEPDAELGHEETELSEHQLWTDRDILLLQILLSAELLLRLDAISVMGKEDVKEQWGVSMEEFADLALNERKVNWDLVLARRFLDNIVVAGPESASTLSSKPRGLLSILRREEEEEDTPISDIILLPRHQMQQLLGLINFAEAIKWPDIDAVMTGLGDKLGMLTKENSVKDQTSVYGTFLDPTTPSISVYGTPLPTPRSGESIRSSYFGNVAEPTLNRGSTARSLKVPISTSLLAQELDGASKPINIGGWLSRSYLSGLILPGEVISHFLISTLLENDKFAIAALGDSANLYGGFVYGDRIWWSKNSVAGRVLACVEGAAECMGWISIPGRPEGCTDGWYVVDSEQIRSGIPRKDSQTDIVERNSAVIPGGQTSEIELEALTLALDPTTPPIPSLEFTGWTLIPTSLVNTDDHDSGRSTDVESCRATLMFTSIANSTTHTLTLSNDVYFISSFPCTPSPSPQFRKLQRLSQSLSRSSSKRSTRSMRSTRSNTGRPVRRPSRRNSHGFEPLLSHPPDSPGLAPTRMYSPVPDEEPGDADMASASAPKVGQPPAHPLHVSYKYRIVQVTEILDPGFLPNLRYSVANLDSIAQQNQNEETEILILDARGKRDLELLGRAWCAERGLHAIVGRVERTCLSCCVREARGSEVSVVIRI